jgi:hypothetical protein
MSLGSPCQSTLTHVSRTIFTYDLAYVKALTNGSVTYLGPRTLGITSTARFLDEASNARGNSVFTGQGTTRTNRLPSPGFCTWGHGRGKPGESTSLRCLELISLAE